MLVGTGESAGFWEERASGAALARLQFETKRETIANAGTRLGYGIGTLINVIDPSRVVVGGGLGSLGDAFLEPVRAGAMKTIYAPDERPKVEIIGSPLGAHAGTLGVALLAEAALPG